MEKNKNRTDLLAAGRKKLQQFRQNKDTKGSSSHGIGKASHKTSKSEHELDTDLATDAVRPITTSEAAKMEITSRLDADEGSADSALSHSVANSVALDSDVSTVDLFDSPVAVDSNTGEEGSHGDVKLALNDSEKRKVGLTLSDDGGRGFDSSVPLVMGIVTDGRSILSGDVVVTLVDSLGPSSMAVAVEGESLDGASLEPVDLFTSSATMDATEGIGTLVQVEGPMLEEEKALLHSQEDLPNMPLTEMKEDQEAGSSGSKQRDASCERSHGSLKYGENVEVGFVGMELEKDGRLVLPEHGGNAESLSMGNSERMVTKEATREAVQTCKVEGISVLADARTELCGNHEVDVLSVSDGATHKEDETSTVKLDMMSNLRCEVVDVGSSYGKCLEAPSPSHDSGMDRKEGIQAAKEQNLSLDEVSKQRYLPEESVVVERKGHEKSLEANSENFCGGQTICLGTDPGSVDLCQLAEVFRRLNEEEVSFLLMSRVLASKEEFGSVSSLVVPKDSFADVFNILKDQIYFTSVEKEFLHLQLTEQFGWYDNCLVNEVSKLRVLLEETQERNTNLSEELVQCRSELQAVSTGRDELQHQLGNARGEIEDFSSRAGGLQIKLERSHEELTNLLMELADFKGLVTSLQHENGNLSADLILVTEERKKIEEEREYVIHKNGKLSAELVEHHERLAIEHAKYMQLEVELKEVMSHLEKVTEENIFLSSSLDIHKAMVNEIDNRYVQLSAQAREPANQFEYLDTPVTICDDTLVCEGSRQSPLKHIAEVFSDAEGPPSQQLERAIFDDKLGFVGLERHLDEAEKILQKLEKSIEGMHSNSASLSRSGGKVAASGISKLIQAFETKVHHDESESEELLLTEERSAADPFKFAKEQTVNLRDLLKELCMDAEKANDRRKEEHDNRELANVALRELEVLSETSKQQYNDLEAKNSELELHSEAIKQQASNLEAKNSELSVLNQDLKQQAVNLEAKNNELEILYEASKQQIIHLEARTTEIEVLYGASKQQAMNLEVKTTELEVSYQASKEQSIDREAKNNELVKKLSEYQSRISELQRQSYDIQKNSEEMAATIFCQVDILKKEMGDKASLLEREWNSYIAEIIETVGKLDGSIGRLSTTPSSSGSSDGLDVGCHVAASVNAATKVIGDLQQKLEAAYSDHEAILCSYKELNEKFSDLNLKNESAVALWGKFFGNLKKLINDSYGYVESEMDLEDDRLLDHLEPRNYEALIEILGKLLGEKLQLESTKNELKSELMKQIQDIEELNRRCVDTEAVLKLVEDAEGVIKLGDMEIDPDKSLVSRLESMVHFSTQKYIETSDYVSLSREKFGSEMMELSELQEKIQQLSSLNLQHKGEIHTLKGSLSTVEEALEAVRSELRVKAAELEQSEQRVSSAREKLSIAVAKGKGLIVQRDNLKQSLAETSSQLERRLQELQLKDARLHDIEMKLKAYMEAGERVEALESELSYIRNSATALRESFLLKDSILQRIEEILEDLELPEHFHSRDTIEKIQWLARSVTGNTLPPADWDRKSSVREGSYSDTGFVIMDAWKEDAHPSLNTGDDLRRKYEELQSKFYGLAEQNEMLEQSLMERNNLVRRWEEVLDRINMPLQLRSMEPEGRIEWLGSALFEAHRDIDSFQMKIDEFESYCGSLRADLEESQRKISDLEATLQSVINERARLFERLEYLTREHRKISEKAVQYELEKGNLQNEVSALQEKLVQMLEHREYIEGEIRKLHVLVSDTLQSTGTEDLVSGSSNIEHLEGLLRKLVDNYVLFTGKPMLIDAVKESVKEEATMAIYERKSEDALNVKEQDPPGLKEELKDALDNLARSKEEMHKLMEKHQSLVLEVEELGRQRADLQERLHQEEQKSASTREKLNVAVRKGKGLLQQRDGLKQTIEEMDTEIERLKNELNLRENAFTQYEQKIRDFSIYSEKVETLESENLFLSRRLEETEKYLRENGQTLSRLLNTLHAIDIAGEFDNNDPVQKLEGIGKLCHDLDAAIASSEHEARKSKRAADLLLAELNEVQERNDGLQEELAKAEIAVSELTKERNVGEAAKLEAFSRLEKLSTVHSEERKNQFAEVRELKDGIDQLRKACVGFGNLLAEAFSKDVQLLNNIDAGMRSLLKQMDGDSDLPIVIASGGIFSSNSIRQVNFPASRSLSQTHRQKHFDDIELLSLMGNGLQECMTEIDALKEKLYEHSISIDQQVNSISGVLETVHREIASQKESYKSMKGDITNLELVKKEKDNEIIVMCRNMASLYEACTNSIMEIENRKAQLVGNGLASGMHLLGKEMNFKLPKHVEGQEPVDGWARYLTEECIRTLVESLFLAVKDSASTQAEMIESSQKELNATVLNLQKELREKDIRSNKICVELVGQIKEAEAAATNFSLDLESIKSQVNALEKQVEAVERERNLLDLRVKELQDGEATLIELQGRIKSLTDAITAKDQEIEALMQALDEEEAQMEGLTSKIEGLEKVLQQKNLDLENLEASRRKAVTKLSITVSKFEELHHLSESLFSEVENLQSQLQDRDAEISFLRQEVTKCTNDVLAASRESNNRNSNEIHELLTWLDMMISRVAAHDVHLNGKKCSLVHEYKEILERQLTSIINELEDLRTMAQSRDNLLQSERSRVEDLLHKREVLENSLREKEHQLALLQGVGDSGQETSVASTEILEVEPMINKRTVSGTSIAPHVRSLRKVNDDQVAISIDMDLGTDALDDEEDDKDHGFKSLTTSRIVPRFTRPVTDMIDGLWVSCDRALMRQPALRLGIIIYWTVLHTLLATFVV